MARKISLSRWFVTLAAFGTWSAAMLWLSHATRTFGPQGPVLAGVLFTVPLISLWEWLVHGVLYHRHVPGLGFMRVIHHSGHHGALFPPRHYVQESGYPFMRVRNPFVPFRMADNAFDNFFTSWGQVTLHFLVGIPSILLPAWLLGSSPAFFISCTTTLAFISWLLAYVHGVIHTPKDRWIERMRWFQWLDRHHYIHHVDKTANINFLIPICDFVIGTQKWALTESEARANPTFEQAKPMAADVRGVVPAPAKPA